MTWGGRIALLVLPPIAYVAHLPDLPRPAAARPRGARARHRDRHHQAAADRRVHRGAPAARPGRRARPRPADLRRRPGAQADEPGRRRAAGPSAGSSTRSRSRDRRWSSSSAARAEVSPTPRATASSPTSGRPTDGGRPQAAARLTRRPLQRRDAAGPRWTPPGPCCMFGPAAAVRARPARALAPRATPGGISRPGPRSAVEGLVPRPAVRAARPAHSGPAGRRACAITWLRPRAARLTTASGSS